MKKLLFLSIFLCYNTLLFAQINLNIKEKKIDFFRTVELENKGELIKNEAKYINEEDIGQPIIYKREQNNLPDLLVYYFPLKKDSSINYILYEWHDNQALVRSLTELKPYFLKYDDLLKQITTKYGKSQVEGSLEDTSLIEKSDLTRKDRWENDTTNIEMYITLSNKHLVQGNMSINPTHTIRLYVRNPAKRKVTPTLSKEKINQLDAQIRLFLADIRAGKFDDSRKYIAPQVVGQVKNEQLNGLKEALKDDEWDLDSTGTMLTSTGKSYSNFRYSRHGDANKPPLEILSILFDEDDKIIAVQPLKR